MINKRAIFVLMALMVLIIGVTAVSAEDISDSDLTSVESTVSTVDSTDITDTSTADVSNTESTELKTTSNQVKSSKLTADESSTHIITEDTFSNYVNGSGYLVDDVKAGDTLDIQGLINITDGRLVINKAVNVISSTEDGTIAFNTLYGKPNYSYYGDKLPKVAFIINNEGSYTNVTGLNFVNTQIWSTNNTHVTFDSLNVSATGGTIGQEVGHFALRPSSTYTTVKNSYIKTADSQSSALVFTGVNYCSAINNTIDSTGGSGNLLYLNLFEVSGIGEVYPENPNCYNELINNTILGPSKADEITYGIVVTGSNNTVAGNTVNYSGRGITAGYQSTATNITITNNTLVGGCRIAGSFNDSVFENNTIEGLLNLNDVANSVAKGNTAVNTTIRGNNVVFKENTVSDKLTVSGTNNNVLGNTLNNVGVSGTNNTVSFNTINSHVNVTANDNTVGYNDFSDSTNSYAVRVTKDNNQIINNIYPESMAEPVKNTGNDNIIGTTTAHIINQDTFEFFVNASGYLNDIVKEGDILDIQGLINITDGRLVINKAVNVISSTEDGTIAFNTPYGSPNYTYYGDKLPKVAFIINNEGSYTNVTGLNFVNTQIWSTNNTHVTFDSLNVSATGGTIGSGVGHFALRPNSTYTTVKNSYIKTAGSTSSAVVFTAVNYCSAINNTIDSTGGSGNILYLNTFGVPSIGEVNPANPNCYNELINNTILGPVGGGAITYGMGITGSNNTIVGNKINYTGTGITSGFGSSCTNLTIANNTLVGGCGITGSFTDSVYENNTIEGSLTLKNNAVATGNTVKTVTISGTNVKFTDNNVTGNLAVSTANNVIANNTISGAITGSPSTTSIVNNTIITDNSYTMNFTRLTNCNVTGNYLIAGTNAGEETIVAPSASGSTIENNLPETMDDIIITDETYNNFFTNEEFTYDVTDYVTVVLNGPFYNKNFIFTKNILNIVGNDATINNGTITVSGTSKASITNMTFVNSEQDNAIVLLTENNNVYKNTITQNRTSAGKTQAIYVSENNNKVTNNVIDVSCISSDIDWSGSPSIANTAPITVISSNNNISNNAITVTVTDVTGYYPTSEAITLQGTSSKAANNNTVTRNNITLSGMASYQYGINVGSDSSRNNISNNNINVTGTTYAAGIQISAPTVTDNTVQSNNINVTATADDSSVYGVILSNWYSDSSNTKINSNTIYGQASNVYLIEAAVNNGQSEGSTINSNQLYATGDYAAAIVLKGEGFTVNSNTIEVTGTSNESHVTSDSIPATTAGILLTGATGNTVSSNTITATNGPAIKLADSNNTSITSNKLVSDNVAIYLNNSNNNDIKSQTINNLYEYTVALENSANNNVTNNYLNGSNLLGGDVSVEVISGEDNTVVNNTPIIIVITDDNYSNYFDDNGKFTVDNADYASIGSDLNNKDLIFDSIITIVNAGDYTINNGTIEFDLDDAASPNKAININNINFNNTDKSAYLFNVTKIGASQQNIYVTGGNIYVTGEDVTAIDVPNDLVHVYLSVEDTNITVEGKKATAIDYVGKTTGTRPEGYLNLESNNITVNANDKAIAINVETSDINVYYNNIVINSNNTARGIVANNSRMQYSDGFSNNNVTGTAKDINAITYLNKPGTDSSSHYIRYNNIDLTSENPITAIDIENVYGVIVSYNNVSANAVNDETPVILLSNVTGYKRTSGDQYSYFNVRYNYVVAEDVYGDDAIEATDDSTIIVENNYPTGPSEIEIIGNLSGKRSDVVTITANVKDEDGNAITSGEVTFVVGNETIGTVGVTSGVATIDYTIPAGLNTTNVTAIYKGTLYTKSEATAELEVTVLKANVTVLTSKNAYKPQDTITLTAIVSDNGVLLNEGKVIFKLNGLTLKENSTAIVVNVENGYATVKYTLPYLSRDQYNITAVYSNVYYDRAEGYNVLNIVKSSTQIRANATSNGTHTTISGVLLDSDNNNVNGTTKLTIKINGLTFVKEVNVTNGVIDEVFDTSSLTLDKFYNLTIIAGETKLYQSATYNTVFVINSTDVAKIDTQVVISSVVDENGQTQVVGTVTDTNGNAVTGASKITVKVNGITVLKQEVIQNGQINVSFDSSSLSKPEYNLTVVYAGSAIYNSSKGNSTLIRDL